MARTTGTVSVRQLLDAKLLRPNERLVVRRRSAPEVEAVLEDDGRIRVGNRVHGTPSSAARDALNVGTVDGWLRWRVPRLGYRTLAELRTKLA